MIYNLFDIWDHLLVSKEAVSFKRFIYDMKDDFEKKLWRLNLSNVDLSSMNLENTHFVNVDFSNTNFSQTDFSNSTFFDCDFSNTDFTFAKFFNTHFHFGNFSNTNFSGVNLFAACFKNIESNIPFIIIHGLKYSFMGINGFVSIYDVAKPVEFWLENYNDIISSQYEFSDLLSNKEKKKYFEYIKFYAKICGIKRLNKS